MPGSTLVDEIELIIGDNGGGGGGVTPPAGGEDDGEGGKPRGPNIPPSRRYATAIVLAMISIFMFFMAIVAAFIFLRATNHDWVPLRLPGIVWFDTIVLITSSAVIELARRRLSFGEVQKFQKLWLLATGLGLIFLAGQLIAWRELVQQGLYVASTQASSFFYIFTGLHGLHLFGGICALLFVGIRKFENAHVSRAAAAEVASYLWHFLDGLWIFLLALLFFGK